MSQPEARLQRAIQQVVKNRGGFCFKVHGSEYMMAGLCDLIACYKGQFIGFEVKMPQGRLSERQQYVMAQIVESGGTAAVVRSVEHVIAILDRLDKTLSLEGK